MLEVERFKPAIALLERALEHEELRVEAHYLLAIALETEGRSPEAQQHFLAADQLNRQQPAPEWAPAPAAFETIARAAFERLPEILGRRLRESLLHVLDYPSLELVAEGLDPRTPAYLAGTPAELGEPARRRPKARRKSVAHLKGVFVYRRNIENAVPSAEQLESEIFRALVHEGAYFFGLDDEEYAGLLEDAP
jgi:predicted Zn-dependent protease with MMP-like domain